MPKNEGNSTEIIKMAVIGLESKNEGFYMLYYVFFNFMMGLWTVTLPINDSL